MSVPSDQMSAPAAPGPGTDQSEAPGAATTMTPQQPKGEQAAAQAKIRIAIRMIEQALPSFHGQPEEQKLLKCLLELTKTFAPDEDGSGKIMA